MYVKGQILCMRVKGQTPSGKISLGDLVSFVSYFFQLDKIVYIFGITSRILMEFLAKQSSRSALTNELQN